MEEEKRVAFAEQLERERERGGEAFSVPDKLISKRSVSARLFTKDLLIYAPSGDAFDPEGDLEQTPELGTEPNRFPSLASPEY